MKKLLLTLALLIGLVAPAYAADEIYAEDGLALKGADVVAYRSLETGQPAVMGSSEFTTIHNGVTFQFASQQNLDAFNASPNQYLPAYGGYCAYGMAVKGNKVEIDPNAWAMVGDTLYLNYSPKVQQDWMKDTQSYIRQADANWQKARDKPFSGSSWF